MIFNSLGSNYDLKFALKTLFSFGTQSSSFALQKYLSSKYGGETTLIYKGREAIKLALKTLNLPPNSKVGITGFTCFVVCKAVEESGYKPFFIDIAEGNINFDVNSISKVKDLRVLIVQNTLGFPSAIVEIKKYCQKNNIILIEDMAHCVGMLYKNDKEAGQYGDLVVFSFSQDKSIDAVSGGALVVRNNLFKGRVNTNFFSRVSLSQQIKDRFYPIFTLIIRKTYKIGVGKILHFLFKNLGILSQPVEMRTKIHFHTLPGWYCNLIKYQFAKNSEYLRHRKEIVKVYEQKIKSNLNGLLRYPIFSKRRDDLIAYLRTKGVYVSDVWYDSPVSPIKLLGKTSYKVGSCPISEETSKLILNLPTHVNISVNQAVDLSNTINKWQNTQ